MAYSFLNLSKDLSDYFNGNGSIILLRYGKALSELEARHLSKQSSDKELAERMKEVKTWQENVEFYFEAERKQASLKEFICRRDAETTRLDLRITAIAGFLMFKLLADCESHVHVGIISSVVSLGVASNSLEIRRVIAGLLVEEKLLALEKDEDSSGANALVGLHENFLQRAMGDSALLTERTIKDFREKAKEKKDAKKEKKEARESPQKTASQINSNCNLRQFVSQLPLLTPQEYFDELGRNGYIGQEHARRSVCLSIYRFISRLKKIHIEGMSPKEIPMVGNLLLKGETGTGKSFLFKALTAITRLPILIEDITRYSETGFVGEEVHTILSRALQVANGNVEICQACSVICIDEIDKISNPRIGNALVSRDGVSRSLLKLIEGVALEIPVDPSDHPYRGKKVRFDTGQLLWIGIGAFSGLNEIVGKTATLGFSANSEQREQVCGSSGFSSYGFQIELLGRFTGGLIEFDPLSREEMMQILLRNTLPKYERECELSNMKLTVNEDVFELLINGAMQLKTGARGLTASLHGHLSKALFQAYSVGGTKEIQLIVSNGQIMGLVKGVGKKVEVELVEETVQICAG